MSETRSFPFGGVAVYNPQSLSKGEALAQFHARQNVYLRLIEILRDPQPSHVLIIGTRGMGKTTLLQRVRYGVEDDAALNDRYLVLAFPEEQYNVNRLSHFLLNTLDALADAVERLANDRMLTRIESCALDAAKLGHEGIEELVPTFLAEVGQDLKMNFLLLVDNADRLFETIPDREQWRLRELLSSRPDLTLFGATTQASEGIYGHDRAFYEFFNIQRLTPLTLQEVRGLLLRLSEDVEEPEGQEGVAKQRVENWLEADPARLRTLVQLTGGNPRTTVLLFNLVLDGLGGGAREYLEQLLDQCTPNYKGRVDELSPQAQQVLDAVALRWDPAMAMEVAADTGLDNSTVSTHLTRLVRQGILEKADAGDSKKALYQIAERFFNIWYLMRASRRVRAKLRWFVEFLRVFFDSDQLEEMAWERVAKFRNSRGTYAAEMETAFAYVLASGAARQRFEDYLKRECAEIEPDWRPYLDLIRASVPNETGGMHGLAGSGSDEGDATPFDIREEKRVLRQALEAMPEDPGRWIRLALLFAREEAYDEAEVAVRRAIALDPTSPHGWILLGGFLAGQLLLGEAEEVVRKAIQLDKNSEQAWAVLGMVLAATDERREEALAALRRALELNPADAQVWEELGSLLGKEPAGREEAEVAIQKAIQLDPTSAESWYYLGGILDEVPHRIDEAVSAYRRATELRPESSVFWIGLGRTLNRIQGRADEAESAIRKAIDLKPDFAPAWTGLAQVLMESPNRFEECEAAARKAIKIDSFSVWPVELLAIIVASRQQGWEEAEGLFRKALELDPNSDIAWARLADLLRRMPNRIHDAETAFKQAVGLDLNDGDLWANFGIFLACQANKPEEADAAFRRAMELVPDDPKPLRNLGVLLYCKMLKEQEARGYLRRALDLNPSDPVSAAVLAACGGSDARIDLLPVFVEAASRWNFWDKLLELAENYPPFGKILVLICDLLQNREDAAEMTRLCRAVAYAQLGDFPRATVALEDALTGDPIDLLATGRKALEIFLAAAVRNGRSEEVVQLLDKKGWKDAWRPIYEALRAAGSGSAEYLKRIAVEIRDPAMIILRRIAPELRDLPDGSGDEIRA